MENFVEEKLQTQNIPDVPVQSFINKPKKWPRILLFVGIGIILLMTVFYGGMKFNAIKNSNQQITETKTPQPTFNQISVTPPTNTPSKATVPNKRILYLKDNKLFSVTDDGRNMLDLSNSVDQVNNNSGIIVSKNGDKFCFVKASNISCANTDGTQTKQITSNVSIEPPFDIKLIGLSRDGTKLLFSYELPAEMGESKENPNIKYGIYSYDSSTETTKYVMKSFNVQQGENYDFIGFNGDYPLFAQIFDGYLYKLDLNSNQFVKFSQAPLPAISSRAFIDNINKTVIYSAAYSSGGWQVWKDNTVPDSYSQIIAFDYLNGKKYDISPAGKYAEYQELSVSPEFKNVFYGKQLHQGTDIKTNFYYYNVVDKQTRTLSINNVTYLTPLWLNEDTFLYMGKQDPKVTIYKTNLITGETSSFIENVDRLIFP